MSQFDVSLSCEVLYLLLNDVHTFVKEVAEIL